MDPEAQARKAKLLAQQQKEQEERQKAEEERRRQEEAKKKAEEERLRIEREKPTAAQIKDMKLMAQNKIEKAEEDAVEQDML